MSSNYLKVEIVEIEPPDDVNSTNCVKLTSRAKLAPFANSEIFYSAIERADRLTRGDGVKTVYKLVLDIKENYEFLPGDSIGVFPSNNKRLVELILGRLHLQNEADKLCEISLSDTATRKNATVPKHLPARSTLRNIFLNNVDVQTAPKKLFLKALAHFTENPQEREHLQTCASPKTTPEYSELLKSTRTLLDLLNTFPSCNPPTATILEHLPPLLPRPYSISSSRLSQKLEITFFVLERDDGSTGLCTGWLQNLILEENCCSVPFYFRQPTSFRLTPLNITSPVILVATGTGIAPFRAFLQHLLLQSDAVFDIWLLYGCRYENRDCLYKEELNEFLTRGVLSKLDLVFSRDSAEKKYVQDRLLENKEEVRDWILNKCARIYLCGDLQTVVKDVKRTLGVILPGGDDFVQEMLNQGLLVVDSWT